MRMSEKTTFTILCAITESSQLYIIILSMPRYMPARQTMIVIHPQICTQFSIVLNDYSNKIQPITHNTVQFIRRYTLYIFYYSRRNKGVFYHLRTIVHKFIFSSNPWEDERCYASFIVERIFTR